MLKRGRFGPALFVFAILVLGAILLPLGYADTGVWRLISPTEFSSNPAAAMRGVFAINGGTGSIGAGNVWAVGDSGLIFRWDGFSWRNYGVAPTGGQLNSVNFGSPLIPSGSNFAGVSSTPGWIVGNAGTALFFDGTGWSPQTAGLATTTSLLSVYTVTGSSPLEAWAVGVDSGNGVFWHWLGTPGGGGFWGLSKTVTGNPVNSVYMTHGFTGGSADDGWAVGNAGQVYRWIGGGWNVFQTVNPSSCLTEPNLYGVAMDSTTDGWAVGSCGSIYHFSSGTWNGPVNAWTTTNDLLSIVLLNNNEGWAVGKGDATGPTILHGTNLQGTPSWNRIAVNRLPAGPSIAPFLDMYSVTYGISGNNIWAVGAGGLMALCSSGCSDSSTWGTTTSPLFSSSLESVFMTGDNDGWAVGLAAYFSLTSPQIFHWDGATFTRGVAAASNKDLLGVFMTSSSEGWAVGGTLAGATTEATVHYTGGTWTDVTPPGCGCILRGIYMSSSSNGWAVGSGGKIELLTNSAGPWTIGPNSGAPTTDLYGVYFDPGNSQSGWAVGGGGGNPPVIIHTANGGLDGWPNAIVQPGGIAGTVILRSIYMKDNNHIWVVGYDTAGASSVILFSGNNGATWTQQLIAGAANPLDLYSVFLDSNNDGWAVGRDSVTNYAVAVHYDGTGWTQTPFTTTVPNTGTPSLVSVFLTSSTNGLAVGDNAGAGTLALAFHLDPPGVYGTGTTVVISSTSTVATTSTSIVSSSTSSATSFTASSSTSTSSSQESTSTSQTSTSQVASSTLSSIASSVSTVTVTSSSSSQTTPLVVPAIPGFPWESIAAGILVGLSVLIVLRRRRSASG
jgi:hypothetical protein